MRVETGDRTAADMSRAAGRQAPRQALLTYGPLQLKVCELGTHYPRFTDVATKGGEETTS